MTRARTRSPLKPPTELPAKDSASEAPEAVPPAAADWDDEPVPLGTLAPLPSFPLATLPGYMAAMASAVATEVQVPADLPASIAMGVLSMAAGGRAQVVVRGQWREPVNLYLVTAMPPGSGKSPAFRLMSAPVFAAERQMRDEARQGILAAEIAREAAIARAEKQRREAKTEHDIAKAAEAASLAEVMPVPAMPRLTADDITPEQAATIMAEQDGRLAVLSAEGTFFSILMGRYSSSNPNLELVLKAHAGDRVQVDRRGRAELIECPALTIATTVQPGVLRELAAKPQLSERGMIARFLLSLPPDMVGSRNITPDLVPDEVVRDYAANVEKLVANMAGWTDPAVLSLTAQALKLHTEWRQELEPRLAAGEGDLSALRDWAAKLPGATARIAGLIHLGEYPDRGPKEPIGEEVMERAIIQARYWADHAMGAYGAMRSHPRVEDARAVLDWIASKAPLESFSRRDVLRSLHRRLCTADAVGAALGVLREHGYIRPAEVLAGPGRKSDRYDVHPQAVTR